MSGAQLFVKYTIFGGLVESARDRKTKQIVDAEDLWLLEFVDKDGYECEGCGLPLYPASFLPSNLPRPYFKAPVGMLHLDGCDVPGKTKLVARGRVESVRKELETSPGLSPSKLVLRDYRKLVDADLPISPGVTGSKSSRARFDGQGTSAERTSRREANTIRPICKAFVRFPFDRDLSLDVPGIAGHTYAEAFRKLGEVKRVPQSKILIGELNWGHPKSNDEYFEIPLSSGTWVEKRLVRKYRIRVHWKDWSHAKRTKIEKEFSAAKNDAQKAKKEGLKAKGLVFMIGDQNPDDDELLHVHDHRLLCCLVDEVVYPHLLQSR
jgi:hypothetical protein